MIEFVIDPGVPANAVYILPTEVFDQAIAPYPPFEGKDVDGATLKVATGAALELTDEVVRMDQVITIQIEAVVEQVDHRVHRTSGRLIRYQVARPLSARLVPPDE